MIEIRAVISTFGCITRVARADLDGRVLTLTVEVELTGTQCHDAPIFVEYEAIVLELDPGAYELRVVHERRGPNGDQDVFRGRVEVK